MYVHQIGFVLRDFEFRGHRRLDDDFVSRLVGETGPTSFEERPGVETSASMLCVAAWDRDRFLAASDRGLALS